MDPNTLFSVEGKSAIVTGGASGIGYAISETLSQNGALVTLLDIDATKLEIAREKLARHGGRVRTALADITKEKNLREAFDEAAASQSGVDIVFANAGIDPGGTGFGDWHANPIEGGEIENYDMSRWRRTLDVNLDGAFLTVREAARQMRPRRWGRIIITSSATAETNPPFVGISYLVAKAGVAQLMRQAAHELAPLGITVNAIAPGIFATDIKSKAEPNPEMAALIGRMMPMGRIGDPRELQGLALFLASDASSYMTGVHIQVDGGYMLRN